MTYHYRVLDRDGRPVWRGDRIVSWHGTPATLLGVIESGRGVLVARENGLTAEFFAEVYGLKIERTS